MKKEIILPVANIGAGKSTLAKQYAKKGYIVISRDSFRYMINAQEYKFNPKIESSIKKSSLATLKIFLKEGYNIFYDETNINSTLRKQTIKLAKKYNYKVTVILLPKLSKEESVKRRVKDPHGNYSREIWESVWERFEFGFEEPSKKEGIDKIVRMK